MRSARVVLTTCTAVIWSLMSIPANADPAPPPTIVVNSPDPSTIGIGGGQPGSDSPAGGDTSAAPIGSLSAAPVVPSLPQCGTLLGFPLPPNACGPAPAQATPPPPTPQQLGAQAVATLRLPAPTVSVPPGVAMAGRLAYLVIGGPQTQQWNVPILGVPVAVTATSTYDVNWGDGTPADTGITDQGAPWPSGHITHAYQSSGHDVLTLTQHWTATWTTEGVTGTIGGLFTTGTLNLTVIEVQTTRD